jgi:hypothetical protein
MSRIRVNLELFIIRGKVRTREYIQIGVGITRDYTLKRRDLNSSHTLGYVGRNNINPSTGSSGDIGGTSPGQTRKEPNHLSGGGGREEFKECGFRRSISTVIHT